MTPAVLIGVPAGNGWIFSPTVDAVYANHGHDGPTMVKVQSGSLLTLTFNRLLGHARAACATGLITHFAMVHNDVVPAGPWLATLLAEYERSGADVLSCAIAIKDPQGLTSTALGHLDDPYDYRRITTTELAGLPATFDTGRARRLPWAKPSDVLLINTGCWVTDMRKPMWRERNADGCYRLRFTITDRQWPAKDNDLPVTECAPEDWNWSRDLARMGVRVYATRMVPIYHATTHLWGTRPAWGSATDTEAEDFRQQYGRPDLRRTA